MFRYILYDSQEIFAQRFLKLKKSGLIFFGTQIKSSNWLEPELIQNFRKRAIYKVQWEISE